METKKYLSQITRYDRMIANKMEEIKNLRVTLFGISSFSGREMAHTSGTKDFIGSGVSKIADLESEIRAISQKRDDIVHQIEKVTDTDMYDVLAKRFILNKSFGEIGADIHRSDRQTYRIYDEAVKKFEKMFGSAYLSK